MSKSMVWSLERLPPPGSSTAAVVPQQGPYFELRQFLDLHNEPLPAMLAAACRTTLHCFGTQELITAFRIGAAGAKEKDDAKKQSRPSDGDDRPAQRSRPNEPQPPAGANQDATTGNASGALQSSGDQDGRIAGSSIVSAAVSSSFGLDMLQ